MYAKRPAPTIILTPEDEAFLDRVEDTMRLIVERIAQFTASVTPPAPSPAADPSQPAPAPDPVIARELQRASRALQIISTLWGMIRSLRAESALCIETRQHRAAIRAAQYPHLDQFFSPQPPPTQG